MASLAGVSEPTVSRVLNGRRGVAPTTRDRVLSAIAELGYDESVANQRPKTGVVGVITPELDNPVFPALLHALDARLARHGYTVQVGMATTDTLPEERQVGVMLERDIDGIVFLAGHHADLTSDLDLYVDLVARKVPIVLVNGRDTGLDVPHLYTDEGNAARRGIDHLIDLGHERIGLVVGPQRFIPTRRIVDGFTAVMAQRGRSIGSRDIVETLFTVEGGQAGAVQLIEQGVTGILAGNDLMALGVVRAARSFDLDVPGMISVVGYDGTDITAFFDPPLTTLRQPIGALGEMAADALASEIDGSRRHRGVFPFSAELLARGSTGSRR